MPIEDLLKDILGAAGGGGQEAQSQQGDVLDDLVGSFMGGGTQQPPSSRPRPQQQSSPSLPQQQGGLSDLLGSLLGGGQAGGGAGGILGALLGGSGLSNSSFLAPISQALSKRLGLSPQVAQAVVAFAATTVIPALLKGVARKRGAELPVDAGERWAASLGESDLDPDDLLQRMGTHDAMSRDYLESTGMAQQLAAQTGLDEETAARSLQQAFLMFGDYLDDDDIPGAPSRSSEPS